MDADGNELVTSRVVDGSELEVNIQIWGVSFMIDTHELTPGDVVTAWGIVFNEPSQCTDGVCNSDDVMSNPAAVASMFTVGGKIVGPSGSVKFFNSFDFNDPAGAFMGPGLTNAEEAEIHVVLVSHGPVQPENLEAQLTTPSGGCDESNPCQNLQFAIVKQVEDYAQPMFTFPTQDELGNQLEPSRELENALAELVVDTYGATQEIQAVGLPAGDAVTSWWVIFNNPENCSNGVCNGDDVLPMPGNALAGVSVVYADGQVVSADGTAIFRATLSKNDTTGAVFGPGLINLRGAEIHYVLRTHGSAQIGETLNAQLTTINGGCDDFNPCVDLQFAVFQQN
jgi:hypothetical protein